MRFWSTSCQGCGLAPAGDEAALRRAHQGLELTIVPCLHGRLRLQAEQVAAYPFHTAGLETLIVTTSKGRRRLEADHGSGLAATRVRVAGEAGAVTPGAVLDVLSREFGVRLLLHEGGPRLHAAFLGAGRVDELFLTVAPQIAGRQAGSARPGLVEGLAFTPKTAPWFRLMSAKRSGDHLYLRLARAAVSAAFSKRSGQAAATR